MKTFTSKCATPLGLPRGYALQPGASEEVPEADADAILATPYVAAWIKAGHIEVTDKPKAKPEPVWLPESD